MNDRDSTTTTNNQSENEAQLVPLVPVSELEKSNLPVITISPSRRNALSILGARRAKSGNGSIKHHEQGILGEFAVAKYLGIPRQIDDEIYENGDPGYDLVFQGKRIDVKTVGPQVNNPFLPVPTHTELQADYYVLAHQLNQSNYRIFGYAHRQQVRKSHTITFSHDQLRSKDQFGEEVYVVEQDVLRPIARIGD